MRYCFEMMIRNTITGNIENVYYASTQDPESFPDKLLQMYHDDYCKEGDKGKYDYTIKLIREVDDE